MSPDQINALYQKYLGRAANPDEISGWQSGQYGATDPASVEAQIAGSGEAQARQGGRRRLTYPTGRSTRAAASRRTSRTRSAAAAAAAISAARSSGWYQQYLGRAATPDEVQGWLSGTYGPTDPASIQQQIASSGEAQARQGGSGGSGGGGGYGGGLGGGDNPFGPWTGSVFRARGHAAAESARVAPGAHRADVHRAGLHAAARVRVQRTGADLHAGARVLVCRFSGAVLRGGGQRPRLSVPAAAGHRRAAECRRRQGHAGR